MKPHKCTECKFEYGSFGCARSLKVNPYTSVESNAKEREPNENGICGFFEGNADYIETLKSEIKTEDLQDDEDRFAMQEAESEKENGE